ncbi:hypothetical protein SAMN04489729_6973 [Amycolatopsis lurida]|nr:hypothetical protein SAMN04489729_6973 [Amycolatopsis lurida]
MAVVGNTSGVGAMSVDAVDQRTHGIPQRPLDKNWRRHGCPRAAAAAFILSVLGVLRARR